MKSFRRLVAGFGATIAALVSPASAQVSADVQALVTKDVRGAADSPLTGRYAGSAILAQTVGI